MAAVNVGGTVFSSVIPAITFSAGSWAFSMIEHKGYLAESQRRNKAIEKIAEGKEKFYVEQVQRKNKMQQLRQDLADANQDEIARNHKLCHALLALTSSAHSFPFLYYHLTGVFTTFTLPLVSQFSKIVLSISR